jgi:hypothetical protein
MKGQNEMDRANIIESIDVLEAQKDLLDITRRDDVYNQMLQINDMLSNVAVFPSLLWAWTFDIIKDIFDNNQIADLAETDIADEGIPEGVTLKLIFDKFWEDVDTLGFTMDNGGEILEECIRDWMRDNNFLVSLDDDSWLE